MSFTPTPPRLKRGYSNKEGGLSRPLQKRLIGLAVFLLLVSFLVPFLMMQRGYHYILQQHERLLSQAGDSNDESSFLSETPDSELIESLAESEQESEQIKQQSQQVDALLPSSGKRVDASPTAVHPRSVVPKSTRKETEEKTKEAEVGAIFPSLAPGYYAQVATFSVKENAERLRANIDERIPGATVKVSPIQIDGHNFYRVLVGPDSKARAEEFKKMIRFEFELTATVKKLP